MSLISRAISNLFNGVSQQTPALRSPSQADEQLNFLSDPVFGLSKRPPTEHIARITTETLYRPKAHTIARDAQEKYQVVITDGDLRVFDLEGQEKSVSFPAGKGYLSSTDPRGSIKCLTVQDYTFVSNKEVIPQAATSGYLETDQVSLTLNFGEGDLSEPKRWPMPAGRWLTVQYQLPWVSSQNNPLGLFGASIFTTSETSVSEAIVAVLNQQKTGAGFEWDTLYDFSLLEVKKVMGLPEQQDDMSYGGSAIVVSTPVTEPLMGTSAEPGFETFNMNVKVFYGQNPTVAPIEQLRQEVGYPEEPYHVPGALYQDRLMPYFDGRLFVSVNGQTFSVGHTPSWTAADYANFFKTQIEASFPYLTVTLQNGWQLSIVAPPGEDVLVGAWDSKGVGYVRAIYSELPNKEAVFVVIKSGVQEQTYSVSLNGNIYGYSTGPSDQPNTYKVDTIANALGAAINAGLHGFQAAVYGNFIKVVRADETPITFAAHDTWNDQAMYAMKNRVQAFEDLPEKFVPGHVIEVVGDGGTGGFYVHFTQKGARQFKAYGLERQVDDENNRKALGKVKVAGNTWNALEGEETGLWEEVAKPGTPDVLIPATMPHVLISNADGSFVFRPVDWFKREAGDADSVPTPSFVGNRIVDVFFHRNRLGFLTEETVVFSRASQFFNFWAQTARDVLDSDPIDVQVNHTKASALRHTAVFNNVLMLFSDTTQFIVSAAQLLTPKTVTIQPSTEFEVSSLCKPVTTGSEVHFVSQKAGWSSVWEYFVETNAVSNTAVNIASHVPKYLPESIWKMASSTTADTMVALSDVAPGTLYVYKYMWGGRDEGKVQQSWSRWTLAGSVLNVDFVDSLMLLTVQHPDGVYFERIDMTPRRIDPGLTFYVHLDRRVGVVRKDITVSGVQEPVTWSHFEPPYPMDGCVVVSRVTGQVLEWEDSPLGFKVQGDHQELLVGQPFESLYRFSPVLMRDNQGAPIVGSQLQLKTWGVSFEDSMGFELVVSPAMRKSWTHKFTPKKTGLNLVLSQNAPTSGLFRVPVGGSGETTRIELRSGSHYPCAFTGATWEADYTVRSRRV